MHQTKLYRPVMFFTSDSTYNLFYQHTYLCKYNLCINMFVLSLCVGYNMCVSGSAIKDCCIPEKIKIK